MSCKILQSVHLNTSIDSLGMQELQYGRALLQIRYRQAARADFQALVPVLNVHVLKEVLYINRWIINKAATYFIHRQPFPPKKKKVNKKKFHLHEIN